MAVPTALALVAQVRDRLLAAAAPFARLLVEGERVNLDMLRETTRQLGPTERLATRLAQLREMLVWADAVTEEDAERGVVTCPAGQTSTSRLRDHAKSVTKYRFAASICRVCPLVARCMKEPPGRHGRTVCKSDYQAEHDRVRQKASTPQYAAIRREHPKVERKLGEVMNRHGGRRARYWGRPKVLMQQLMACTATNVKRLVRLGCAPRAETICEV